MLAHLVTRWLRVLALTAAGGVVGAFVLGEFGQGRVVPTAAGAVIGGACGLALAGFRSRLFDAMFPPGETKEE